MELKSQSLGVWTASSPPKEMVDTPICLVFGQDVGGVMDLCLSLIPNDERVTLEGNMITANEIFSHTQTFSLFGGGTTVLVRGATDKNFKELEVVLNSPMNEGTKVIIQAGALKGTSKLKKAFAASKSAKSVCLYNMRPADIGSFAIGQAKLMGCTLTRDASALLAQEMSGDRAVSARMMETVCLHTLGSQRTEITRDDVTAVVRGADETDLSAPLDAALTGDLVNALRRLDDKIHGGENPITLLRLFTFRLGRFLALSETGKSAGQAIAAAKPPVFWSDKDIFTKVLSRNPVEALRKILVAIDRIEHGIVENGQRGDILIAELLIKISKGQVPWPKF
jgi:DNA polymerase-3 subunit delta